MLPLDLQYGALVCAKYLHQDQGIAISSTVVLALRGTFVSLYVKPAPGVILLLLLLDALVYCTDCSWDIKADDYEGHEYVPSLTPDEEGHLYQI